MKVGEDRATGKPIDENASLKRIAWAFGCAKKGSMEEWRLQELLLLKVQKLFERAE